MNSCFCSRFLIAIDNLLIHSETVSDLRQRKIETLQWETPCTTWPVLPFPSTLSSQCAHFITLCFSPSCIPATAAPGLSNMYTARTFHSFLKCQLPSQTVFRANCHCSSHNIPKLSLTFPSQILCFNFLFTAQDVSNTGVWEMAHSVLSVQTGGPEHRNPTN